MVQYYSVSLGDFSTVAVVRGDHIKLGNPEVIAMPCVHIEMDEDTLVLHGLSHHEFCNRLKDMQHGEHGTVKLLKLSIQFAKYLFPSCTRLKLQDTSGYHDRHLGSIDLATKSMLLYGMTWYQKHLQDEAVLKPTSKIGQATYRRYHRVLNSQIKPGAFEHVDCFRSGVPSDVTVHEAIQIRQPNFLELLQICQFYKLPPLMGFEWEGPLTTAPLTLQIDKIKKPPNLKAQWGGRAWALDAHLLNVI